MSSFIERLAGRVVSLEKKVNRALTSPQLGSSSIENGGSIEEYDEDGQLVQIIGTQPDGTHGAVVVSGPIPPRPSAPVVSGGPLLLNYGWAGTFAGDDGVEDITIPHPMDFARVEAHASKMQGFSADTAATLLDTLESPRGGSRTAMLEPGTWFVVLVTRSTSGKRSPQSAEVAVVVEEPVGSDIDVEELRNEWRSESDALNEALRQNALELADAQGRLDTLTTRTGTVESSLATVQTQVNTKNKIINSTGNASGTTGYVAGDTWQKWTTLDDGGKLVAAWRFTASNTWLPVILDPTYLPLVDIGQGTFGELEGARLKIGSGTNLIPNGAGEWGKAGAWASGLTWDTTEKPAGRPGSFSSNGGSYVPPVVSWDVEPNTEYRFEVWVKASVAGSVLYIEMRDQVNAHAATWSAITGETSAAAGSYPVSNYAVPTGWTKLTAKGTTSATASKMRVGTVYFNHTNGTVRDATQYIAGMRVTRRMDAGLIVENTIKGYHVDAESVGAQVGAFVEADIGKLRVVGNSNLNTVTAERIAANVGSYLKLYASQLLIGEPGNMLPDPGFQDPEGWQITSGYAILPTGGRNGNQALEIAASAGQVGRYYGANDRKRQFRVTGGATYQAKVWYKSDAAITAANRVAIYGKWTNPSTATAGNPSTPGFGQNTGTVAANTWTELVYEFTVPAEATHAFIGLYVQGTHNSRVLFSEPSVREKITPSLIVDGFFQGLRVIGASIETNAAVSRGIKMNDSGLFAYSSTGQETLRLDGQNNILTGATIRTAASGARVQMSSNGLEGWGADNTQYLKADASGIEITGSIAARGLTAESTPRPIAVRMTTVTRDVLGAPTVINPGIVFDDYAGSLSQKPGIYSPTGKELHLFANQDLLSGNGRLTLEIAEARLVSNRVYLGQHSTLGQTTEVRFEANEVNVLGNAVAIGRYPETPVNIAGTVKINGQTPITDGSTVTRTRLTLTNGYTQWTGGGWNGLWMERLGKMVIITGAVGNSSAWSAGSLIANISSAFWPVNKVQGVNCELQADGRLQMGGPGSTAQSMSLTYFLP